jgi:hypothetical protein
MSIKHKYKVESIIAKETYEWLLYKHYAKRIPHIKYSFGLYKNKNLCGVLTIGNSPSKDLTHHLLNGIYINNILELNRLCVNENMDKNILSYFVSQVFKLLPKPLILVSYADTSQNHNGYIYQATNWIYTGLSYKMKEWREKNTNKHSRNISKQYTTEYMYNNPKRFERVERARKHRYIYFIGSKTQKKNMYKNLKYKIMQYPKGINERYDASYKPKVQTKLF